MTIGNIMYKRQWTSDCDNVHPAIVIVKVYEVKLYNTSQLFGA